MKNHPQLITYVVPGSPADYAGILSGDVLLSINGEPVLDLIDYEHLTACRTLHVTVRRETSVEVHVLQGEREMAQYNKSLGRFQLAGIAPAPRGIPQIEVTFDIDANGIVHVSAKDLGTGNQQQVTITASTNLNESEIKRAVEEAERYAKEDKERKEAVDTRNHADQLVYTTEKTLRDLGDKINAGDKSRIEDAVASLRKALEGTDTAKIKEETEKCTNVSYEVFGKIYQDAAQQQAPGQGGPTGSNGQQPPKDDVVDADYEVVD